MKTLFLHAFLLLSSQFAGGMLSAAEQETKPMLNSTSSTPKIAISKETTCLTEPLRPDGYVDYLKAMNERLGRGVTPENNAAIDLIQALGPSCILETLRKDTLARLGLPGLPDKGNYFVGLHDFLEKHHPRKDLKGNRVGEGWEKIIDPQEVFAASHPWSEEEYPLLAAWIDANERPLELFTAGSRKSRYYIPLVDEKGKNLQCCALGSAIMESREALRLLRYRAMRELRDNHVEEAWNDILIGYRWARLYGQGPLMIDRLVATALEGIADSTVNNLVFSQKLTVKQAAGFLQDLDRLPHWPPAKEIYDFGERIYMLDAFQEMAIHGYDPQPIVLPDGEIMDIFEKANKAMKRLANDPRLDWNEALRYFNGRQKRFVDAWDCPDFVKQRELMNQLQKELSTFEKNDIETVLDEKYSDAATPTTLARHLIEVGASRDQLAAMYQAETRRKVGLDLSRLALALAGYRDDHHAYPRSLTELCPRYLPTLPADPFSGNGLIYKPEEEGYLLYSVGPNGIDDGGRNFFADYETAEEFKRATEEEQATDDIAIRTPPKNPAK
jgi:hypothetical protein